MKNKHVYLKLSIRLISKGLTLAILCAAIGQLVIGCSSSDEKSQPSDASVAGDGAGNSSVLVGSFQVNLVPPKEATATTSAQPGLTQIIGRVNNGPTPSITIWEEAAKEGDCILYTPRVPFCQTSCGGSAACIEDDTCQAYPTALSVGSVKVKGLHTQSGATEFSMDPIANNYQIPASVTLAFPPFSEGEEVRIEAAGGDAEAFTLQSNGISVLTLLNETIPVSENQALTLSWTPPEKAGISKIHIKLDISHHGGSKGKIECDTDDTGSHELSASLITQLIQLGVAGFPTVIVTREAVGSTTITKGRVALVIASAVEKEVEISGLISCNEDNPCPDDKVCQDDSTCK